MTPLQIATELGLRFPPHTPERTAALHEAGHVVVARARGVRVDRACAVQIGWTLGHTAWTVPRGLSLGAEAAILLGGVASETIAWRAMVCSRGCSSDLNRAWALLGGRGLREQARLLSVVLDDTRELLAQHWDRVLDIADELDELGCINRREIAALMSED